MVSPIHLRHRRPQVIVDTSVPFPTDFPGARQFREEVKRRLLSRDPFARPSLRQLEGHDFFSNEFNHISHFLENLVLKGQEERKTFFR